MNLVRLVFFSTNMTLSGRMSETVQGILQACSETGLTGTVLFNDKYFLQAMEGPRVAVSAKLGEMFRDSRQKDLTILSLTDIAERRYLGWLVAVAARTPELQSLFVRFGATMSFEPPMFSPQNAEGLLSELWRTESRFITKPKQISPGKSDAKSGLIPPTAAPALPVGRAPQDTYIGGGRSLRGKLNS